jgi:hypothetical protein
MSKCLHSLASATLGSSPKGVARSNDLGRALAARPRPSREAQFLWCTPLFGVRHYIYAAYTFDKKYKMNLTMCQTDFPVKS